MKVLEKARNPEWRIQDGLHFKIMTQLSRHQVVADQKGNIFKCTIYFRSFDATALILSELRRGPLSPPHPTDSGTNRTHCIGKGAVFFNVNWGFPVIMESRGEWFTGPSQGNKEVPKFFRFSAGSAGKTAKWNVDPVLQCLRI